jgi:hypothetical protein
MLTLRQKFLSSLARLSIDVVAHLKGHLISTTCKNKIVGNIFTNPETKFFGAALALSMYRQHNNFAKQFY